MDSGASPRRPPRRRTAPPMNYDESLLDRALRDHLGASAGPRKRRRLTAEERQKETETEAMIALSLGFPIDALVDAEVAAGVVSATPQEQNDYIVVRNHILARWRANVRCWLSEDHIRETVSSRYDRLVSAAYDFLYREGYINFGVSPAFRSPSLPLRLDPDPDGDKDRDRGSVLVVGAGLAGLAAARHLLSLGFKVAVLEGRRRPGGRVFTKRMASSAAEYPDVAAAADLGGSVLTGINGNPLGVLARQLGFPLHKVRDKCPLYLPDGRPVDPVVDSRIEAAFNELLDKVCRLRQAVADELRSVDASLGDALEAFRAAYGVAASREERMLLDWHLANLEYANAALLSDLSMAFWDQDDPYEMGGDHCFIPGGNARFVRALAQDVPVFYGRTVTRVRYAGDGVLLQAGRQLFRADMALCTVPLGVLKKGRIHFSPPLPPRKQAAIQRLGFGLLNKVAILFPYDFWDGSVDTFGHLTDDPSQRGEFFLFYSYASVSGGPLLVALVAGESAIRFETTPPMDNVDKVLRVLRRIFSPKGIEIPKPLQAICTRWGTDRFAYGSYSYVAVGSSGDDYDILAESAGDGRLFFAGEATNRRYPATMHGALLSGFREAANIARAARRRATGSSVAEGTCVKDDVMDLDDLFRTPDLSFGAFTVLHDPSSPGPDSTSLLRVGIGERKLGSGSLFLYGLISRKHAEELAGADGDDRRLSMLYRNYGTKLAGRNGLGSPGESLIARIKATRSDSSKSRTANGTHNS